MKLNYNQIINYIRIRGYLKSQCSQVNEFFKVKAHFRDKNNKEYLILSFDEKYDAGFALIRENNSNIRIATYSIKNLFENEAIMMINSPELKKNIVF